MIKTRPLEMGWSLKQCNRGRCHRLKYYLGNVAALLCKGGSGNRWMPAHDKSCRPTQLPETAGLSQGRQFRACDTSVRFQAIAGQA